MEMIADYREAFVFPRVSLLDYFFVLTERFSKLLLSRGGGKTRE